MSGSIEEPDLRTNTWLHGHGIPQGEALHFRAPTLGSRQAQATRDLTGRYPNVDADGPDAHPSDKFKPGFKKPRSPSLTGKIELLLS